LMICDWHGLVEDFDQLAQKIRSLTKNSATIHSTAYSFASGIA
jgi:hypothetical protein